MARILVVDDEADLELLIKQKFRKKIKAAEFEFIFAHNGREALSQIEENEDVDLVLSDINMPEMDGLTLLSKLNDHNGIFKTVIVSAYGDLKNIRTAMNRGAYDFITKPIDFSDLEITIDKTLNHVLQIKETLKAIKENNILKMYVDETVLNFMSGGVFENTLMQNETINASVAFIDLCRFTFISEQLPPDEVVQLLNNYFDMIVKEIIDHGGIVDKFMGDAVMAVYKDETHTERAIQSALAIKNKIEQLPKITKGNLDYKPDISIGINSGELVSGNIGSESLKRLDFTVIGNVVNTAQRLQSKALEGQILVTEQSLSHVKDIFKSREVGKMDMKNKAEEVVAFEILG